MEAPQRAGRAAHRDPRLGDARAGRPGALPAHPRHAGLRKTYVLMLTGMSTPEDIVTGLNAGANDFIVKPFNEPELQARINVGVRMVELQRELTNRDRKSVV